LGSFRCSPTPSLVRRVLAVPSPKTPSSPFGPRASALWASLWAPH